MAFFALSTSIVVGVGIKDTCNNLEYHLERCHESVPELARLQAAVGGAAMAGILFACYGFSEYAQYRKRHIQGDKVKKNRKLKKTATFLKGWWRKIQSGPVD